MLQAGLACSRFLHDAALIALFGVSLFPLYAFSSQDGDPAAWLDRRLRPMLVAASIVALLSCLSWLSFTTANMAGSLSDAIDWTGVSSVLSETTFGQVWLTRSALIAVLVILIGLQTRQSLFVPALSAAALAGLAGVGHTQVNEGATRIIQVVADGGHLLAAGAWLGGLIPLAYVLASPLRPSSDSRLDVGAVLLRFSGMGVAAVAVLVGSGLLNSFFLVGSFANLVQTPYGWLLLIKLFLFGGMLVLAAVNRYRLVPALIRERATCQPAIALARLRRHVLGEQVLGLLVVLVVSVLGTMEPAINSGS